jgi:hypothetical protein
MADLMATIREKIDDMNEMRIVKLDLEKAKMSDYLAMMGIL